ncbi:hypothetical protein AAKU55_002611 [Oxalobacteraceae bacterium GrIS 1.11]
MAESQPSQPIEALLSALKDSLSSIEPASADEANIALPDTVVKLPSGLIGKALTVRLCGTAWADEPEGKKND